MTDQSIARSFVRSFVPQPLHRRRPSVPERTKTTLTTRVTHFLGNRAQEEQRSLVVALQLSDRNAIEAGRSCSLPKSILSSAIKSCPSSSSSPAVTVGKQNMFKQMIK